MTQSENHTTSYASTRNACKLCAPLGASVVFKGIRGCVPMIHGSQGCATYIRRYMISHFKEPVDIASSNFSEETTIFGGHRNFNTGIDNIIHQYHPEVIGIASACLSETIGEDIQRLIHEYCTVHKNEPLPAFVHASTPSYQGTHMDGFHQAVLATVAALAKKNKTGNHINLFPGFISPEDIRYLKDVLNDFGLPYILFPDYSDSLDNPNWEGYQLIPEGGTAVEDLRSTGSARASVEMGYVLNGAKGNRSQSAAKWLEENCWVPVHRVGLPIGIRETDRFFEVLEKLSGRPTPERHRRERGRLVDAYVDGHKYHFGKRAVVYGEEDLVIALTVFLEEIGIEPVLIASGGESGQLKTIIETVTGTKRDGRIIINEADFELISELAQDCKPDLFIGNSKGYYIARQLGVPLVRVGFPIHDRFGGQRIQHLGYKGTQQLYDRITNALIECKQERSKIGYKYI